MTLSATTSWPCGGSSPGAATYFPRYTEAIPPPPIFGPSAKGPSSSSVDAAAMCSEGRSGLGEDQRHLVLFVACHTREALAALGALHLFPGLVALGDDDGVAVLL